MSFEIEWKFQGFVSSREDDRIIGSKYRLLGGIVPELIHILPYDSRNRQMCEEEDNKWINQQKLIAAECESFEEYVQTARTMIGIMA
jgi:hypothetical protein